MTGATVEADVTTGELGRRFDRFETTVTGALDGISKKMDDRPDWTDVRNIEKNLMARIKELEDWQKWATRLVLGAVLLAILGVVLVARPPL